MATITDYATLKTAVADYLHRSDLSDSVISGFVQFGEARLNRRLRLFTQETSTTVSTVVGQDYVALPSGWMETVDIYYTANSQTLYPQNTKGVNSQRSQNGTRGKPVLYSTAGGNINFEVEADQIYSITIDYFQKWDIETDDTNWLLQMAPDAYLYASLLEAKAYVKKREDLAVWGEGLTLAIGDLNDLDGRTRRNATARVDSALVNAGAFNISRGY